MTIIREHEFDRGVRLELHYDVDPPNPRVDYDEASTMVCWHRREDFGDVTVNLDNYDAGSVEEFIAEYVRDEHDTDDFEAIPLWLYQHSGSAIKAAPANPFHCPWDSGQVGWVYMTAEKIAEEYGDLSDESRERARQLMVAETEVYDHYVRGECYGYVVEGPTSADHESCWGFLGDEKYAWEEGVSIAETIVAEVEKREAEANFAAACAAVLGFPA